MNRPVTYVRLRWIVCGLLFLVTTANYMDRSALGLVEPVLKHLLGGDGDPALYNRHYSDIVNCFIVAYGFGFLLMGRGIDKIGARLGLALSVGIWAMASIIHRVGRCAVDTSPDRLVSDGGTRLPGNTGDLSDRARLDWHQARRDALCFALTSASPH